MCTVEQVLSGVTIVPFPTELTELQLELFCEMNDSNGYGDILVTSNGCIIDSNYTFLEECKSDILKMYQQAIQDSEE